MNNQLKNSINYALNCIKRYRIRTLVILVCLVVATSMFTSVAFMQDGLVKEGAIGLKYAPDLTVQGISSGRQALVDTSYIGAIKGTPGVKQVEQRIWGYGNIGNTLLVIVGIDLENQTHNLISGNSVGQVKNETINPAASYPIESGTFLKTDKNNTVVIGKAVAQLLDAKVGSGLTILTESNKVFQYEVVGVFDSQSSVYNADMILMNINDARSFFNVPQGKATDLAVYTNDVTSSSYTSLLNTVARQISYIPNIRVLTKDVLLNAQETTYGARSGFFSIVWYVLLIAVAIIAFNQTVVVGHESKFEVGLLKALGFSTTDIIKVRLIESTILGVLAGSIGLTVGILYDVVFNAPVLKEFMLGWATLYPSFTVPVFISPQTILLAYAISIVPLLFATVVPSWINATVDPDIAMRGARA
jgi:ABC-type lipoprotein release transport system permease subunit